MGWVAGLAGMAGGAAGQEAGAASTVEGAKAQAEIEAMNRAYQRKVFEEQKAMHQPYYEAGLEAQPVLEQFRTQGRADLSQNPLYQMQQSRMAEGLDMAGGVRPGSREYAQNVMAASSQEPAYQRALDLQRVGWGQAGQAGMQATNLGGALAQSYQTGANAMMRGTGQAAQQRQGLYGDVAGQVGSMPAYYDYLQKSGEADRDWSMR